MAAVTFALGHSKRAPLWFLYKNKTPGLILCRISTSNAHGSHCFWLSIWFLSHNLFLDFSSLPNEWSDDLIVVIQIIYFSDIVSFVIPSSAINVLSLESASLQAMLSWIFLMWSPYMHQVFYISNDLLLKVKSKLKTGMISSWNWGPYVFH